MLFFIAERKLKYTSYNKKQLNFINHQGYANFNHNTIFTFSQDRVSDMKFTLLPDTNKDMNVGGRGGRKTL